MIDREKERARVWCSEGCSRLQGTLQQTAAHCSTLQHTAAHCSTLQHTATQCNTLHLGRDAVGYRVAKKLRIWWIAHLLRQMARFTGWIRKELPAICENLYASAPPCSPKMGELCIYIWSDKRKRECERTRANETECICVGQTEQLLMFFGGNEYVSIHHIYICAHVSCMSKHTHKHTRQSHKRPTPHTKQLSAYQHVTRIRHNSGILDSMHDADVASLSTSKSRCVEREKEN